ncbi:single-stranded DNA-binding protein WHY1, chloroplastic-like isoform X2 [Phaseolus vulgaris]|uniref:single-stranded DNA-binding protein WHY1, chloroplastic-like isoform X2 n=1 Tax=Phaseolus vulgaris TaxID=3885 RepID=UPI0035CC524D
MSRVLRSLLTLKHLSLPFRSFVPPKFIVPLNRNFSFIFPTSLSVRCNHSNLVEPFPPLPQNPPVTKFPLRVYADYSVYTSKGVLTLAPKPPGFESKASGAFGVSREGYMLLQFAPSVGTEESIYDWNQKQVFSLSVSEMGTVISLGEKDSWEFSRKSAKPNSNGIEVRKVLKVEPLVDATGHSFSLSVYKKPATMEEIEENIYLPVTRAHLAVLSISCRTF